MAKNIAAVSNYQQLKLFDPNDFVWKLGRGDKVKFLMDDWSKMGALFSRFYTLFNLTLNKHITMKEMSSGWDEIQMNCTNHWRRKLRGWELDELQNLDSIIKNISLDAKMT